MLNITKLHVKTPLICTVLLGLIGCGGGETDVQSLPLPPVDVQPVETYSGPAPRNDDVQNFKLNVWDNLADASRCGGCHVQGNQAPFFVRNDDINEAYTITNTLVNRDDPAQSQLITKVAGGHNCWAGSISACTGNMETWIESWLSVDQEANTIVLEAPTPRAVGANKNFPESPDLFAQNVHSLMETYCSECHSSGAAIPISPYIGSSDVSEAYLASISKLNLDFPADSRVVVRLRDEFHGCWDDCQSNALELANAIETMADAIPNTQLDANLVASDATSLYEGVLASGGGRFETNVVAKWEFQTGFGNIAYDTSGVSPLLDLTISGDFDWVGGWGIQLRGGKAQGSTSNSRKLHDLLTATGEFSIEAWVAPANVTQEGPARIISYSGGDDRRNFMLGQTLYNYDFLVRNDNTDANGEPSLSTLDADEDLQAALQHVVVNYDGVNGRQIFINGEFTDDTDDIEATLLGDWDDSFAFVIGSEVSGRFPFEGTVRMVAIHNRTLTQEQIVSNFDAGIGQRFYVMFGVSDIVSQPETFVVFEVSQFDSYSYLFNQPFMISLDSSVDVSELSLSGMRIGINGREEESGQVFATLDLAAIDSQTNDLGGRMLSRQATIIPVQKGPELDEFFLTFDEINNLSSVRIAAEAPVTAAPVDLEAQSEIGIRDFAEINASMAALTDVNPQQTDVLATYNTLRQQLPTVTRIGSFLTANQMAITQMSIKYCDALVENNQLRVSYFPSMDFSHNANNGFDQSIKDAIVQPILQRMLGDQIVTQPDSTNVANELNTLIDRLSACSSNNSCAANTTTNVVKATCAAVLGSASVTLQ
ncbi:MAG: LamG domain-containing protein [Pseudomonadota bacterium]